jgi:type II secretory pathway pseudopilin PulG
MSNNPSAYSSPTNPEPSKTSGMAITSLVLGLLSFLTCILTGVPAIVTGIIGLMNISNSRGRLHGRGLAIAGIVTGSIGSLCTIFGLLLIGLLLPAVNNARESGRRTVSMNQMRNIATAMQSYASAKGQLPDRANLSADGKPLLSWRVHVLPYLGQAELYAQFHLDEPWDSAHNRTLIDLMPAMYSSPDESSESHTLYLVPYGPGAIYEGTKAKSMAAINAGDGAANTILLVEADPEQAATWTKPEDWEFKAGNPAARLGHLRGEKFIAVMADGSARVVPTNLDKNALRGLFTVQGGEPMPPF